MIFNEPEIESKLNNDDQKSNCQVANKILKLYEASEQVTVEQTIRLKAKGRNTRPILVKINNLDKRECYLRT